MNQGPDVLDVDGLYVEVGDGVNLVHVIGVGEEGCVHGSDELLLNDDEVALEGIRSGLLLLPHELSSVLALTGGGGEGGVGRRHIPGGGGAAQAGCAHTGQTDHGQGWWGCKAVVTRTKWLLHWRQCLPT
jgi:hypothetical protein